MIKLLLFLSVLVIIILVPQSTRAADNTTCLLVPILMYHHIRPNAEAKDKKQTSLNVSPENFDKQLAQLSKAGYSFLSLDEVHQFLTTQTKPGKAIAITFDDGYNDNYTNALPILKKYSAKASLMLTTGLVGGEDYASWDEVKEMKNSGVFSIYNHTWSHYALSKKDPQKVQWEIETAQQQLEEHGVASSKILAYPYGAYNKATLDLLTSLGYKLAVTTHPSGKVCANNILTLPRRRVGNQPKISL